MLAALPVLALTSGWTALAGCCLSWALLTLAIIDWRHMILPDAITLPLIPAGLAAAWTLGQPAPADSLTGALAGAAVLWAVRAAYRALRGREGLGLGDVKLFAAAGAWLGWAALPAVLLAASLLALGLVAWALAAGRKIEPQTALPFGTPLAGAVYLVWLAQHLAI